jgi:outer membrane receptor protein involved in Fe transport
MIPIGEVEKVEVVRGGHSATYGADALAGVVNVVMRPSSYTHTFEAATSVGSFGYKRYQLSGGTSFADLGIRASYQEERSAEDFPFRFHNGNLVQAIRRVNADLFTRYGSIQSSVRISDDVELVSFAHSFKSERGVGGAVVSSFSSSRARQTDKDNLLQMALTAEVLPTVRLRTSLQGHFAYQRYRDPDLFIGFISLDNYFKNVDLRLESSLDYTFDEKSRIIVGGELVRTSAKGNSIVSNVKRSQVGSFLAGEHRVIGSAGVVSELVLYPALRFDAITSSVSSWSPRLGLLLAFKEFDTAIANNLKPALRASISRNFRVPTFNELYFNGGGGVGNPNLRPERSVSFEMGGTFSFSMAGEHYIQASYFLTAMNDRIVWVAAGGLGVTPKNIRKVRTSGIEASYEWRPISQFLTFKFSHTSLTSVKASKEYPGDPNVNTQLPYIPQETLNLSLSASKNLEGSIFGQVGGTVGHQFVGFRFYTEDNVNFIPSHCITNLAIRGRLQISQFGVITKVEINNVFDEDYQVMIGYPMPLRSYRLTVGVEY